MPFRISRFQPYWKGDNAKWSNCNYKLSSSFISDRGRPLFGFSLRFGDSLFVRRKISPGNFAFFIAFVSLVLVIIHSTSAAGRRESVGHLRLVPQPPLSRLRQESCQLWLRGQSGRVDDVVGDAEGRIGEVADGIGPRGRQVAELQTTRSDRRAVRGYKVVMYSLFGHSSVV